MKDLVSDLRKNNTNTKIINQIDDIVCNIVNDDYEYESNIGQSQTTVEALEKLNNIITENILEPLNNLSDGGNSSENLTYYLVDGEVVNAVKCVNEEKYVVIKKLSGYTSSSVTTESLSNNNTLEFGYIKDGVDGDAIDVSGVLPCIYHEGAYNFKMGILIVDYGRVQLILSDNSILTDTAKTIYISEATGILQKL